MAFLFAGDLGDITHGKAHYFQTDQHLRLFAGDVDQICSMINAATKKFDGNVSEGLAKINIQTSEQKPYELLSTVSNILYNNHISIQNEFFYSDKIILILSDRDAATAYELLRARTAK